MTVRLLGASLLATMLVACPVAALDPSKRVTQYVRESWQTENGLPQNTVQSILQTRDGYLWLATQEGLVRFDGNRFTVFDKKSRQRLENPNVFALLERRPGELFFGTYGGGLYKYQDGTFTAFTTREGLSNDRVWTILQTKRGDFYAGTLGGGLNRFENGHFVPFLSASQLGNGNVLSLLESRDGSLFIGTMGGGLHQLKNGERKTYTMKDGLASDSVWALSEARDGSLWIGTMGGLNHLANGALETFTTAHGLTHNNVRALLEDRDGNLWIATFGGGLNRFHAGQFASLSTKNGLPDDIVTSLFEDREGNLFAGTMGGGLTRLRDGKFTPFGVPEGLSHDNVRTLFEDRSGGVWAGTLGGGLNLQKDGHVTVYGKTEGLPGDKVYTVLEDASGTVWAGTGGGLARIQADGADGADGADSADGAITALTERDGLSSNRVWALLEDRHKRLWIGSLGGGINILENGKLSSLTVRNGLSDDHVSCLLEDRDGGIWIGTDGGGLNRYFEGTFTLFSRKNGLRSDAIYCLYQDAEGAVWVGTYGGGLSRLFGGTLTTWTTEDGLFDDVVFVILEDDGGSLWLSSNKGITAVSKRELLQRKAGRGPLVKPRVFSGGDGLRTFECSGGNQGAGIRTRDGRLLFATLHGFVSIDPRKIKINSLPPPVHIEEIAADGHSFQVSDGLQLPPGSDRIAFTYTGLSLSSARAVRFRYKLEGYDRNWIEAGSRRQAYYTNLPPGQYTFSVKACNNDGVWNETGARVTLTLLPFFHQTQAFKLLCAVVFLALCYGGYQFRVRQLKASARRLEMTVQSRTAALETRSRELRLANEELTKVNAELKQANLELRKLNEEKSEFLGIAAHDLRSPLNVVSGYAEILLECGAAVEAEREQLIRRILTASRRMEKLIRNFLDVNSLERGAVTFEMSACNLNEIAAQVVQAHQQEAEAKGQSLSCLTVEEAAFVMADGSVVVQVLENLVSNAVKYSPLEKPIEVRVRGESGRIRVEVADQGPGLTAEDKSRLFGKFARLSARPTGGEVSTGLGLSIVKRLTEAMRGRIWCESEPGKGATFIVDFERTGEEPENARVTSPGQDNLS